MCERETRDKDTLRVKRASDTREGRETQRYERHCARVKRASAKRETQRYERHCATVKIRSDPTEARGLERHRDMRDTARE